MGSVAMDCLEELRREAGVPEVAHSNAYGLSELTLVENLFDGGVEPGSYLVQYEVGGPLDAAIVDVLGWVTSARYRRYGCRLFFVVEALHLDHVMRQVEAILALAGVEWRRKVRRLGRRRVVILGLSVDPASGSITLPKRTRKRLRALEHAERTKKPLTVYQWETLQYLRALEHTLARWGAERAREARVRRRGET